VQAANVDDAREKFKAMNWYEAARRGKGIRSWLWMCPKCSLRIKTAPKGFGSAT
jgi:hypothetical protein